MTRRRGGFAAAAAAAALLAGWATAPHAAGGETEDFMPKGGRTLLLEMLGPQAGAAAIREIVTARHSDDEWTALVAARAGGASDREKSTLAAYLAVNMPLASGRVPAPGGLAAALPRDGRDLAWRQCQFCHSLFTSHLTQSRDVQGWRNMFLSPFHRELKMTPQEREEFARYSAINMPMKVDDVPPELRF